MMRDCRTIMGVAMTMAKNKAVSFVYLNLRRSQIRKVGPYATYRGTSRAQNFYNIQTHTHAVSLSLFLSLSRSLSVQYVQ